MTPARATIAHPADFARLMAPFEPFETSPHVALAVSGGGDSMALTLLADEWARARGGRVTGLTVDHGLRAGSDREAARVGDWLAARGIDHAVLAWRGAKPASGVQNAARRARYDLLEGWCRANGVLHLLVAHNREDQAETLVMRLQRASGPDGLAAMSALRELAHCRVLRPLLGVPRASLRRLLRDAGQPWIEDPSNTDVRFARPLLRLAGQAADAAALAESARRYGEARAVLERDTDALLAAGCRLDAAGFATLDRAMLTAAPQDLALRALARITGAVGGRAYPPRRQALERAWSALAQARSTSLTLGRCRLRVGAAEIGVFRERRNPPPAISHAPGLRFSWDRRFDIALAPTPPGAGPELRVRAFDRALARQLDELTPERQGTTLPRAAYWGLPALVDAHGIFAVPHLKYLRQRTWPTESQAIGIETGIAGLRFHPLLAASVAGFCVA